MTTTLRVARAIPRYVTSAPGDTSYSVAVLNDSPLVYWRHNNNGNDATGNGRAYTPGAGAYVTGLIASDPTDKAVQATGTIAAASWMQVPGSFTWETWFKVTGSGLYGLIGRSNAGTFGSADTNVWRTYINNGQLVNQIFNSSWNLHATVNLGSSGSYNDNVAHHLVITWDGTTLKGYVDGALVGSNAPGGSASMPSSTLPLDLNYFRGNFPSPAVLDETAIYDYALSSTRVTAHYAQR